MRHAAFHGNGDASLVGGRVELTSRHNPCLQGILFSVVARRVVAHDPWASAEHLTPPVHHFGAV
jgi:hypothetical protein